MTRFPLRRRLALLLALLIATAAQAQIVRSSATVPIGRVGDRVWLDVDNDGRDDFCTLQGAGLHCQLSKPGGFTEFTVSPVLGGAHLYVKGDVQWADVNGDGFVDLCGARYPNGAVETNLQCVAGPDFTRVVARFSAVEPAAAPYVPEPAAAALGTRAVYPGSTTPLQFADVDGDGLSDLCTLIPQAGSRKLTLRCHIARRSDGTVVYTAPLAWNLADLDVPSAVWPQGFFDFNGDGLPDFCGVVSGPRLQCVLSTPSGFGKKVVSALVHAPVPEGAAFVDINGDGKVDFCRLAGSGDDWHLRCVVSNGVGWEFANDLGNGRDTRERLSSRLADRGDPIARWWVDINGDGLPDFCRGSQNVTFIELMEHSAVGPLVCSLNLGETGRGRTVFAAHEVTLPDVDFGRSDGGRSFCDPFGTGVPTLCRISRPTTILGETCWVEPDTDQRHCEPVRSEETRLLVGLTDVPSAQPPLLVRFSDGAGAETRLTYLSLTSDAVYSRSSTLPLGDGRPVLVVPRQPVVFETRAWVAGTGASPLDTYTGNARYAWRDLLVDPVHGSRGFRERWMLEEGSNTIEHVVFFQGRGAEDASGSMADDSREFGLVRCRERVAIDPAKNPPVSTPGIKESPRSQWLRSVMDKVRAETRPSGAPSDALCTLGEPSPNRPSAFALLSASRQHLGDTVPANPRLRAVNRSDSKRWNWDGGVRTLLATTTTATTTDDVGNTLRLIETTTDSSGRVYGTTTTNTFGQDNRSAWLLGRLTHATVASVGPDVDQQFQAAPPTVGNAPGAKDWFGDAPTVPSRPPLPPGVLAALLQLLLDL